MWCKSENGEWVPDANTLPGEEPTPSPRWRLSALPIDELVEASFQSHPKQFVLPLRDPHLLEIDLFRDPAVNTFGASTQALAMTPR